MSRSLTIKQLAERLAVSVPTLRKYGECGLLPVDAVDGRTNLYDEAKAVGRVEEINALKSRGYSLSLMREYFAPRAARGIVLELGDRGASFTPGTHVMLACNEKNEYMTFVRSFLVNGIKASQAALVAVDPEKRHEIEATLAAEGLDVQRLVERRQLHFIWYGDLQRLDPDAISAAADAIYVGARSAGFGGLRVIGHPDVDWSVMTQPALHAYEARVERWVQDKQALIVCPWVAPNGPAQLLLNIQRCHEGFVVDGRVFREVPVPAP